MVDLLIKNGFIITMDKERRLIKDGAVVVNGTNIIDVGTAEEIKGKYSADRVIDATNKAVMPGMIDSHAHDYFNLSMCDHMHRLRAGRISDQYLAVSTKETYYIQGLISALERLKFGNTLVVTMFPGKDDPAYASAFAEGINKVGVRAVVSITFQPPQHSVEANLKTTEHLIKRWHGDDSGLIRFGIGPNNLGGANIMPPKKDAVACFRTGWKRYMVLPPTKEDIKISRELGATMRAFADKHSIGIHTHGRKGYVKFVHDYVDPKLWLGPNISVVHCRGISDEEIQMLAKTGTKVIHCPYGYGLVGGTPMRLPEFLDAGITVALGTDHGFGRTHDLFREMKAAFMYQRARFKNPWMIPPGKALEMATIDGAKIANQEKTIGSIELGKRADIILVNLFQPHLTPRFNIPTRLVYDGSGHDVDTVIVNGKVLMENRKVLTVNEPEVIEMAQKEAEAMMERSGLKSVADLIGFETVRPHFWGHSRFY